MEQHSPDNRTGFLERKIYAFLAGAIILAGAFFLATGYKQDFFTRMTTLYFSPTMRPGSNPAWQ